MSLSLMPRHRRLMRTFVTELLSAIQGGLSLLQPQSLRSKEREMVKRFSILLPISPASTSNDSFIGPQVTTTTSSRHAETQHLPNVDLSDLDSSPWSFDLNELGGSTADPSICEAVEQRVLLRGQTNGSRNLTEPQIPPFFAHDVFGPSTIPHDKGQSLSCH